MTPGNTDDTVVTGAEAVPAPPTAPAPGAGSAAAARVIDGRFELLGTLGAGGMGEVWRARDLSAKREVALKLLRGRPSPESRTRFEREGQAAATLDHPGIVRVHASGVSPEGLAWLACELVEGARTLRDLLPGVPLRRRIELIRDAAAALGHAHARGVVHRDVKPANVLVDATGRVRVADFGLALVPEGERLTQTGTLLGTPGYMSPEQAQGERDQIGPATDVWSLGVILYEALTGELPYDADSLLQLLAKLTRGPPRPPSAVTKGVPADLEAVCQRALAQEPGLRHRDGTALADDLTAWLEGRPVAAAPRPRRRISPALPLGLLLLLLPVAAWSLSGRGPSEYPPNQWPTPRDPARLVGPPLTAEPPAAAVAALASAPAWVSRLAPEARPPLPLPAGLAFTAERGVYESTRDGSHLVWVPPGGYVVGAAEGDEGAERDERPRRRVRLGRGLFMGQTEVTWAQFRRFAYDRKRPMPVSAIEDHPARHEAGERDPVFHVTWDDACEYCAWAGLRLPSEVEWECAARGPQGFIYPWGNGPPVGGARTCNVADEAALRGAPGWKVTAGYDDGALYPCPVGSYPAGASPFGCLDMSGNVWEWVEDWEAPYDANALVDPHGPATGDERVIRGGSWCFPLQDGRCSNRGSMPPTARTDFIGFRVARDPS